MNVFRQCLTRSFLAALLASQFSLALAQQRVTGQVDDIHLASNTLVLDGVAYEVDATQTRVIYNGEDVGEESVTVGDRVELVFGDSVDDQGRKPLLAILLVRSSKTGLDS